MDDFASDTDSDYTSYWRDWVSGIFALVSFVWRLLGRLGWEGLLGCFLGLGRGLVGGLWFRVAPGVRLLVVQLRSRERGPRMAPAAPASGSGPLRCLQELRRISSSCYEAYENSALGPLFGAAAMFIAGYERSCSSFANLFPSS